MALRTSSDASRMIFAVVATDRSSLAFAMDAQPPHDVLDSMIASSTTTPTAITNPARIIVLIVTPRATSGRGVTINTMILAGFAIALVVWSTMRSSSIARASCGAYASIASSATTGPSRRRRRSNSKTVTQVRGAVVYASMIEALALLPIFFLQSLTGSFFRPLATGHALAVAVSTLVALISTPAMAMLLLRKAPLERRESPLVGWLQRGYDRLLAPIIRSPKPAYATVGALMVAGAVTLPLLGQALLPTFQERDFLMHWISAPGTSVGEERRIVTQASRELTAIPGVRNFGSHIGQAFLWKRSTA